MRLISTDKAEPSPAVPVTLPRLGVGAHSEPRRVLDFDVETVAAGFADPDWVPQKITCVAWSWIDEPHIESRICTPAGLFGKPQLRRKMLEPLLAAIAQADMLTGHNIERFDLPVINAEAMRLDLPPIDAVLVQDTMRVFRSKGFKKGQDVLGTLFGTHGEKLAMSWQEWQDAYDEPGWPTIRERAESDVLMHVELRDLMMSRKVLKLPRVWRSS
jgi:DNA polymerase elongation subunit (family B)